jgi:hypothetical protein
MSIENLESKNIDTPEISAKKLTKIELAKLFEKVSKK